MQASCTPGGTDTLTFQESLHSLFCAKLFADGPFSPPNRCSFQKAFYVENAIDRGWVDVGVRVRLEPG